MANNVTMPRFSRASGTDGWNEADTFDVDLLAECLLEDGNMYGGLSFDFRTLPSSTVVSPENSDDGNVAVLNPPSTFLPGQLNTMLGTQIPSGSQVQSVAQLVAPPGMNQTQVELQPQIPNLAGISAMVGLVNSMQQNTGQGLIFHDHSVGPDVKRARVDAFNTMPSVHQMQVQAGSQAPGMMNIQELAVAAMQQQGRGRKKSQAQIDRRRERNRILARRTRLRKKFFFESMQKEIMDLQRENLRLKRIVKDELDPDESKRILSECDAAEKVPPAVLEACGDGENGLDMQDYNLVQSIQNSQYSFIITDPSLADNPIVFASEDFLQLTGYTREQVLGRNCRFLQGTDTSLDSVQEIRKSVSEGEDVTVTLLNYRADGTPFWNRLFIAALRDAQNNIVNFIGVVVKVPGPGSDEADDGCDHDDVDDDLDDDDQVGGKK